MRPLRVALVHRNSPRCGEARAVGWWSYPVPEFEWHHYPVNPYRPFELDRATLAKNHDLVVWEDSKAHGKFRGHGGLPVCLHIVDSTLSEEHYQARLKQAREADALLVDWDRLKRFSCVAVPVLRFNYCVNDRIYREHGTMKEFDVGSYQHGTEERHAIEALVRAHCDKRGYTFDMGNPGGIDYAVAMGRCKIVLNVNRNPATRSHRVFDVMAVRSCLLTSPLPDVSGEPRAYGQHYVEFRNTAQLTEAIDYLLGSGEWETIAGNGMLLAKQEHTWARRATQLRARLEDELGDWLH